MSTKSIYPSHQETVKVDTDLSAKKFYFVKYDSTDTDKIVLAVDETTPLYILQEGVDGSTKETTSTIAIAGTSYVKLGTGGCNINDKLTADSDGTAIVTTTAGHHVGAIAMDNGNAGDLIKVQIHNFLY